MATAGHGGSGMPIPPEVPLVAPALSPSRRPEGQALRRKRAVLEAVARDPCALDVVVWAQSPLVPCVLDRLFEAAAAGIFEGPEGKSGRSACASEEEPPLRWVLLAPSEADLRRELTRCQASLRWGGPASMLPAPPMGPNPYLLAVLPSEDAVLEQLVNRATVVLHASEAEVPAPLRAACAEHFVDLIDTSTAADGPRGPVAEILEDGPRRRGSTLHLSGGGTTPPEERATEAVALIQALVGAGRAESDHWQSRL